MSVMRRAIVRAATAGLLVALSVPFNPGRTERAYASVNAVTIVASGGSAEGTNWSYSGGVITASATVSINAADIVAKLATADLTIDAGSILVQSDIVSSTASAFTLKTSGNINLDGGVNIVTQGGDIVFHSDSDASGQGSMRFGTHTDANTGTVTSNGGRIIMGGGANIATGHARSSADISPSKPQAGVAVYGFRFNAGGGDIVVRAMSNSGNGSQRSFMVEPNAAGRSEFVTSGSGEILIDGDGSPSTGANPWGAVLTGLYQTGTGDIVVTTKTVRSAAGNNRGYVASAAEFRSTSGDIVLRDVTDGSLTYNGPYFASVVTIATGGTVLIEADEFQNDATIVIEAQSVTIRPYTSSSFTGGLTIGTITATSSLELTIGAVGNTANFTFNQPIQVGGPFTIHGGNIAIWAALTATNSTLQINASGAVTQTSPVVASGLLLSGSGTFTLQHVSNDIGTLAGGSAGARLGVVRLTDSSGGLSIGVLGQTSGLYSSDVIEIATLSGDITVSQPVDTSKSSGDAVLMYADKDEVADNAGDGHISVPSGGAIAVGAGARALLYSGSQNQSSGLTGQLASSGDIRRGVDATMSVGAVSPAVASSGLFALFRLSTEPAIVVAPTTTTTVPVTTTTPATTTTVALSISNDSVTTTTTTVATSSDPLPQSGNGSLSPYFFGAAALMTLGRILSRPRRINRY